MKRVVFGLAGFAALVLATQVLFAQGTGVRLTYLYDNTVAVQGTKLALSNLSQISPTLAIPMAVPYAAIPACALLMFVYTVAETWGVVAGAGRKGEG